MTKRSIIGSFFVLLVCAGCGEVAVVASNCEDPGNCVKPAALRIDAVDILLVLDNSGSIAEEAARLQAELPRLLEAVTTGEDGDTSFPPASSVHVAVTTTDMGVGRTNVPGCEAGLAQDGVFVKPGEVGLSCEVSYPGYLSFDGQPAPVSTVSSVGCLPLVLPSATVRSGCGWEQPLEAALKSVWPSGRSGVDFLAGDGHGLGENAGFLRDNSLLVVIVVSDEDDCSAEDLSIFGDSSTSPINLRCTDHKDKLYATQRYVDGLKALRSGNDNLIFGVIAGIPTDWVSEDARAAYDLGKDGDVKRYYDAILAADEMQEVAEGVLPDSPGAGHLRPSCSGVGDTMPLPTAMPPRRLLEVAKGFGAQSVIGSICSADYGATTGRLIRAIGERLNDPAPVE